MAHVTLITGGARSGKSAHALALAEHGLGPRAFVATCPIIDDEMGERVRRHRKARGEGDWHTIEEATDLAGVLAGAPEYQTVLVDCLTLWINNLMREAEREATEDDIAQRSREVLDACAEREGAVIFVTNEVGLGVVPDNALARRFRDLVGRCNQVMAATADTVVFVACGIPLSLKEG